MLDSSLFSELTVCLFLFFYFGQFGDHLPRNITKAVEMLTEIASKGSAVGQQVINNNNFISLFFINNYSSLFFFTSIMLQQIVPINNDFVCCRLWDSCMQLVLVLTPARLKLWFITCSLA